MLYPSRKLIILLIMSTSLLLLGTIGYSLIEGWSLIDALYMTAITLTTVGFGEVEPLSRSGQIFTVIFLFLGVGTLAYALNTLGQYILEADLGKRLRTRRSRRMVENMNDHVVLCGYGRVGQSAAEMILEARRKLVVIERDEHLVDELREGGHVVIQGDATSDEMLKAAGLERAEGLIVCTGSDTENLFIVLSARTLNPRLKIVARSGDPENERKLKRAGADRVISPYQLGGRFMANVLTRPHVTDFLDVVTLDSGLELWLEEILIPDGSPLAGHTVVEADLRRKTGSILVALVRHETRETLTPDENTRLLAGDELIVLGTREQLARLAELAGSTLGH